MPFSFLHVFIQRHLGERRSLGVSWRRIQSMKGLVNLRTGTSHVLHSSGEGLHWHHVPWNYELVYNNYAQREKMLLSIQSYSTITLFYHGKSLMYLANINGNDRRVNVQVKLSCVPNLDWNTSHIVPILAAILYMISYVVILYVYRWYVYLSIFSVIQIALLSARKSYLLLLNASDRKIQTPPLTRFPSPHGNRTNKINYTRRTAKTTTFFSAKGKSTALTHTFSNQ